MAYEKKIKDVIQKDFLIKKTNFKDHFENFYEGKVRDNYNAGSSRIIIVTDRLSAFDRIITTIPYKGQLLNQTAAFWFEKTGKNVPNHVIDVPDPNIMIVKECKPLPVEMVIRGYITGSAWRAYEKDPNVSISGIQFRPGLRKYEKLDSPVITPSTKAASGHDEPISREKIIDQGIVSKEIYIQIEEMAKKLFEMGTEISASNGLILVDTKYEFGLDAEENVVVIDEIHTPDSSRYWMLNSYEDLFSQGKDPEVLDKEFFRDWLRLEKNFMGDGPIPQVDVEVKISLCKRYIRNYEILLGQKFDLDSIGTDTHPIDRIGARLKELGYVK
ncbi:MAG: phosphoribosylaminoimidazolesuccinocarboxamide synthase [Promethearchaeota archaeon]